MKPGIQTSEFWLFLVVIAMVILAAFAGKLDPNVAGLISTLLTMVYGKLRNDLKKAGVPDSDIQALPDAATDPTKQPGQPAGRVSLKMVVGLLLVAALCWLAIPAHAGVLRLDLGILQTDVQGNIDAGGMFNVFHKSNNDYGLSTLSTNIGYMPLPKTDVKLDVAVGTVTGPTDIGTVFCTIGYNWPIESGSFLTTIGLSNLRAGTGVGINFCQSGEGWNNVVGGIAVSANLFTLLNKNQ